MPKISFYSILFLLTLVIYLFTHFIRIEEFPIYFFSDEAIQAVKAEQLIKNGLKDEFGNFLPPFFKNFFNYNLGLSVYLNIPGVVLFGKKIWVVRGTTVIITLLGSIFTSLILRDIFKLRNFWVGVVYLSSIPLFFLHSRTGFETAIASALFAPFIYFYLLYRERHRLFLFPSLFFAALAFYSYAGIWTTIIASLVLFCVFDMIYHLMDLRIFFAGIIFTIILFAPFVKSQQKNPELLRNHLNRYNSYLTKNISYQEKLKQVITNYQFIFNPNYLFRPHPLYHPRHHLKNYGYFPIWSFPFIIIGFIYLLLKIKNPIKKIFLIILITSPLGGVVVGTGDTRILPLTIPLACFFGLSIKLLEELVKKTFKRNFYTYLVSLSLFILISLFTLSITYESIINGPFWFQDYGLYGMQYGTKQLFGEVNKSLNKYDNIIVTADYANAADIYIPFFISEKNQNRVQVANMNDFIKGFQPKEKTTLFVTPDNYNFIVKSGLFGEIKIISTILAPNKQPVFYQLKLTSR